MNYGRSLFFIFSAILALTVVVHADMMPVSQQDAESAHSQGNCERVDFQCNNIFYPSNCTCFADSDKWPVKFLPEGEIDPEQASKIQNLQILSEGQNSLNLCISALISLGLCSSFHWVRRINLGFIPEWYHDGGPFQIGHSHALMPGTLCPDPACCFVQPSYGQDDHVARYFIRNAIYIWQKSQFTPDALASRGPPLS